MRRNPLLILIITIFLLALTLFAPIAGVALAEWLIPGNTTKDGQLGYLLVLPVFWLWQRFFIWCGVGFGGE